MSITEQLEKYYARLSNKKTEPVIIPQIQVEGIISPPVRTLEGVEDKLDQYYAFTVGSVLKPPEIIAVETNSPTHAGIVCVTNKLTTAVLSYGTSPDSLVNILYSVTPTLYHDFALNDLLTDQEYYYQIVVTDSKGSSVISDVGEFYLSPLIAPLAIETESVGKFVSGVGAYSSATIECITNRLTTVVVNYGTSPGGLVNTLADAVFSRYHEIAVGSLILEQTVYYQIIVTDSNGNTAQTDVCNFTINGVMSQGYPNMPTTTFTIV